MRFTNLSFSCNHLLEKIICPLDEAKRSKIPIVEKFKSTNSNKVDHSAKAAYSTQEWKKLVREQNLGTLIWSNEIFSFTLYAFTFQAAQVTNRIKTILLNDSRRKLFSTNKAKMPLRSTAKSITHCFNQKHALTCRLTEHTIKLALKSYWRCMIGFTCKFNWSENFNSIISSHLLEIFN